MASSERLVFTSRDKFNITVYFLVFIVFMFVMLWIGLVLHESAHALGGWITGNGWGEIHIDAYTFSGYWKCYCTDAWLITAGPSLFLYLPASLLFLAYIRLGKDKLGMITAVNLAVPGSTYALIDVLFAKEGDFFEIVTQFPSLQIPIVIISFILLLLGAWAFLRFGVRFSFRPIRRFHGVEGYNDALRGMRFSRLFTD